MSSVDRIVRQNWRLKRQNFVLGGLLDDIRHAESVDEQNQFDVGWNACLESVQERIAAAYAAPDYRHEPEGA